MSLKHNIKIGDVTAGHVQGIATDKERRYMYFSFTTCLIKTDMDGNVIGSVSGFVGHLGCIAYNEEDGRIYGSLEYKYDAIGKGILNKLNAEKTEDGFYIAIFDVDKLTREDMDAERDGIVSSVYLSEVVKDYTAPGHKYGCSGIDGVTFAPPPADMTAKKQHSAVGCRHSSSHPPMRSSSWAFGVPCRMSVLCIQGS